MEKEIMIGMVEHQIGGYVFKNKDLLIQAFTRRSFTEENGGENNEVLEFIGDKALDLAVIQLLVKRYGTIEKEFECELNEGELTKLKSRMVEKKNLARRIDELGLAQWLKMGKSDIKNNVQNEMSVKEDLFEAIIGAVAIDSNWDMEEIESVTDIMLNSDEFLLNDEETNYVSLIQEWEQNVNGVIPLYKFEKEGYQSTLYDQFNGISQYVPISEWSRIKYHCHLKLLDNMQIFRGFGASQGEAKMNVCKLAYETLTKDGTIKEFTIRDEIENPNKSDAINQLEILARRGYFSIPTYKYKETHDDDGNPIWKCECRIKEYKEFFYSKSSSKKDAKKTVAFKMLKFVLNGEDK